MRTNYFSSKEFFFFFSLSTTFNFMDKMFYIDKNVQLWPHTCIFIFEGLLCPRLAIITRVMPGDNFFFYKLLNCNLIRAILISHSDQ